MQSEAEIRKQIMIRDAACDDAIKRIQSNPTDKKYVAEQQRKHDDWITEIRILQWVLGE